MPASAKEQLQVIFDAVYALHPLGAVVYGTDGRVLNVNQMAEELYGQQVPPGSAMENAVLAPGRYQAELLNRAKAGEPVTLAPYEMVPPSGFLHEEEVPRWLKEMYNPVVDPQTQELIGTVALVEDATLEMEQRRSLERAKRLVNEIANLTPVAMVVMDQQHLIQNVNQVTEVLSGFSEEELHGKNFLQTLIHEDDQLEVSHYLLDIQTGEAENLFEGGLLSKNDTKVPLRWRFRLVPDIHSDLQMVMLAGQYVGSLLQTMIDGDGGPVMDRRSGMDRRKNA